MTSTKKVVCDLSPILAAIETIKRFNALDLQTLIFHLNGKDIKASRKELNEWRFMGLSNKDFVTGVLLPNASVDRAASAAPIQQLVGQLPKEIK